ncbi:MAG: hypothetical protein HW386_2404, partial [Gammaproteobacteria bacterium]|nr:hypothetical protein [Gammaproteobacteria bacterium]
MFSADMHIRNTILFLCRATCSASVILLCCFPALTWSAVREPALDELKLEVDQLQGRVAYLEEQLRNVLQVVSAGSATNKPAQENAQPQPVPAAPVIATASATREYAIVTTRDNSAINIGGKVKLDALYNSHSTGENSGSNPGDLSFIPAAIPLNSSGEDDQFSFSARQTRLWLKGYSPSDYGEMAGYIEIDFDASSSASNEKVSNSYVPRLRHAYGTIGGITLGQTYTTFMNIAAFPEVNDLNGPVAIVHIRQPLFSYSIERDWGNLIVAMENPETTLSTATGKHIAPDDD